MMIIKGHVSRFNAAATAIAVVGVNVGFVIAAAWFCFGDIRITNGPQQSKYLLAALFLVVPLILLRELPRAVVWFEFDGRRLLARTAFARRVIDVPLQRIASAKARRTKYGHTLYEVRLDDKSVLVFGHAGLANADMIGDTLVNLKSTSR